VKQGTITLRSGTWEWSHEGDSMLVFRHTERPGEEMRAFARGEDLTHELVVKLARDPDLRVWVDDQGVRWEVNTALFSVGPAGADQPTLPMVPNHVWLEFGRSSDARAVEVPAALDLGDLTHEELQDLLRQAEPQR
jgi:hypothetical protein